MIRALPIVALACLALGTLVSPARADSLADFERAEVAYSEQRYGIAATILEGVIAAAANDPVDQAVVLESRKYLAACYLFLDRADDANRQFELLLELDPSYRMDPAVFPRDVVDRFDEVRRRVEATHLAEREAALRETESRLAVERERVARANVRYAELYAFASSSLVFRRNSRVVAILPFGIGQFQNGDRRRGRWFAISEGVLLGTYIGAFIWHQRIAGLEVADRDVVEWNRQVRTARLLNWMSGLGFLTLNIAGAVEAEVNFVSVRGTTQTRPVPPSLRPDAEEPVARLHLAPTSLRFELSF